MDKKAENELIKRRLYYYLNNKNLSINRLAQLSGLSQSTVSNLVNRETLPSIQTLRMICEGLEISVIEFLDIKPYNEVKSKNIVNVNQIELEEEVEKLRLELEKLKKMINTD